MIALAFQSTTTPSRFPPGSDIEAEKNPECLRDRSCLVRVGGVQEEWVGIRVPLGEHGAVLTANETSVCPPQVLTIQMRSQLKAGSFEAQALN
ncbi:hypothetical protein CRENBAI_004202 [Crenichthys baileyi]|uniref:Uncharacterized protein n=1 Tax=Crenichthys baileyi TaxID=28760 RepID=A0AAV9RGL2_9TELE